MIEASNISVKFGEKYIIKNLSFTLKENKTYAVMGKSGVGKTTLLNAVFGLLDLSEGAINFPPGKKKAFIFQDNRLINWLSVFDNVKYVTKNTKNVENALKITGLWEDREKYPNELSGGMKRRLSIARAYAYGGDVFFIDEPLYGLDIKTEGNMLKLIKKMTENKTAFVVTHDPNEAFYLSNSIIFLDSPPISKILIKNKNEFKSSDDLKDYILKTGLLDK